VKEYELTIDSTSAFPYLRDLPACLRSSVTTLGGKLVNVVDGEGVHSSTAPLISCFNLKVSGVRKEKVTVNNINVDE